MTAIYKRNVKHKSTSQDEGHNRKRRTGPKSGREELRTVIRNSRRDGRDEHQQNEIFEERRGKEDIEVDSDQEQEEEQEETDEEIDKGKAYSALLTLLKADHQGEPRKTKRTETKEISQSNQEEEELEAEDEITGASIEEVSEDDEAEEYVDEVEEDLADPFELHFNQTPDSYIDNQEKLVVKEKGKWSIKAKQTFEALGYSTIFQLPPGESLPKETRDFQINKSINNFHIKKRVLNAFQNEFPEPLSKLDETLLDPILNYKDVNFPYKSFKNRSYKKLYVLHAINHIYKTRDRILKNNEKLHSYQESLKQGNDTKEEEPEFRDQGFTRPKVLILLPTRNSCHELVEMIIQLSGTEQRENKKKFNQQFYSKELPPETKPEDFRDAFKGNNNDFFCIGLKFTRKSLKLYSSFYTSDIIIASPIGLSMILENPDKKKRQYDFLSSIEILILDGANQIEMQNWDLVMTVFKYLNKIPKEFHDADFSRIRMWSINDQARLLRQNLIFSEYTTPNINNLLTTKSLNLSGKLKFKTLVNSNNCIMNSIGIKLKQIFQRFESQSPVQDPEARFKFFINSILPSLTKSTSYDDGLLIFIPSYYDYLRIKNYMKTSTKFNFGSVDEYLSQAKLTKTRHEFATGKIKIMLYTERLHYFRRFEISGVKNLLMYGLPSNPIFYKELIRFIGKSVFKETADLDLSFIKVIYSKWDAVTLERIVGNERAPVLCNSVNEMYEFR